MDVEKLKAILEALKGTDVSLLDWENGQEKLTLRLGHPPVAMQAPPMALPAAPSAAPPLPGIPTPPMVTPLQVVPVPAAAPAPEKRTFTVNSPFVGTFYRSS